MNEKEILNVLDKIIDNSKFKNISTQQKEELKIKMLKKFIKELFKQAFEMLNSNQREEYHKLLSAKDDYATLDYITKNIPNFKELIDKTIESYSEEIYLYFKDYN